jgi:hypothetical protein
VVVWLACFLAAHRSRRFTARTLFLASLVGGNIVLLAWFGPHLVMWGQLHSYGMNIHNTLLVVVMPMTIYLVFFLVGLAPAGWLRLRKA